MFQRHAPTLPSLPSPPEPTARDRGRAYHGGSCYPSAADFRPLDRNDRFRVWTAAEGLERRTHTPRKHGGMLGHTGLTVLRCLLFDFLNVASGRLDPTYDAIAEKTRLARSVVIEAVKRLELAGILEITRRIIRERIKTWCEFAGRMVWMVRIRQTSNAYRVNFPTPARRELGDLGAPLLKGCFPDVRAESGNRTETTPVSSNLSHGGLETIKDAGLRATLERMKAALEAREAKG